MTVAELIRELEDMPQDMEVLTEYDYGDRHHTRALNEVESVTVERETESAYSDSGRAVDTYGSEDGEEVVVISSQMI